MVSRLSKMARRREWFVVPWMVVEMIEEEEDEDEDSPAWRKFSSFPCRRALFPCVGEPEKARTDPARQHGGTEEGAGGEHQPRRVACPVAAPMVGSAVAVQIIAKFATTYLHRDCCRRLR